MINVQNIVLHELKRNEVSDELELHVNKGKALHPVCVESLVVGMHKVFTSKSGKGYGYFDDHSCANDAFRVTLNGYFTHGDKFDYAASQLAKLLHSEIVKYPFSDEGVLVISEYSHFGAQCMMIGLIPQKAELVLESSDNAMQILAGEHLDINHMTIAALIDTSAMINSPAGKEDSYVSFMRSGNKRRMNDFFIDFLGIEVATEAKKHSQVLLQAIEDFLSDLGTGEEVRSMLERTAHAYCDGQIKLKEDISLKELSDTISGEFDQSFADYVKDQGYELDDEFEGDRASLRRLVKIAGTGGGLSMSFDARLLNERVFYDAETDTLTVKGTPPAMRDLISRRAIKTLTISK